MQQPVYIVGGARTPIGSLNGNLSDLSAPELGGIAIKAALIRSGSPIEEIKEVYMGCVVQAGIGQAPARQALIAGGLPTSVGATTINKVCGSGLKAIMLGANDIQLGETRFIVAGGMESMSQIPFILKNARQGFRLGHQTLLDNLIYDGLWDPYNNCHMGNCAERCAEKYGFARTAQDDYAKQSYERAISAQKAGLFTDEIVPVSVPQKKGDPLVVSEDEEPQKAKPGKLDSLKPAFEKTGSVTAGNASSINDGAAAVVLASEAGVKQHRLTPMAQIVAYATFSQDPLWYTTAPIGAIRTVLQKANMTINDIDLFEINEAFAIVPMAAMLELHIDAAQVNIRGGGISLGHPIGASGCRVLVTLMYALKQLKKRYGLATLCLGGGEAVAMIIENV